MQIKQSKDTIRDNVRKIFAQGVMELTGKAKVGVMGKNTKVRYSEDYQPNFKGAQDQQGPEKPSFDKHLIAVSNCDGNMEINEFMFSDGSSIKLDTTWSLDAFKTMHIHP